MKWLIQMCRTVAIISVTAVISSMLTMGTTAIVVDRYIQSALDQFHIPIEREPLTAMNLWSTLLGTGKGKSPSGQSSKTNTDSLSPDKGTENSGKVEASDDGEDGSLPVWGNVTEDEQAAQGSSNDELVMTPEEWTKNKDQLPQDKKNEIFSALMKKLPQEDWQRISTLMEDGLTSSELTEVEQILAKHLNDEEYKQMRDMLTGSSGTGETGAGTPIGEGGADSTERNAGTNSGEADSNETPSPDFSENRTDSSVSTDTPPSN
ncbi:spore coat protein [Paenibacillus sp. 1001270B_150601_E10]|uniref:spore coat protein n=1 Tax=Paenibacillus sp. 1001270B_150601_E10 TaxID=2787079 RepID=UPI0018A0722F|nr:spore coat protein [Paenibacillus sp. 1001270B_150601_E10]